MAFRVGPAGAPALALAVQGFFKAPVTSFGTYFYNRALDPELRFFSVKNHIFFVLGFKCIFVC